MKRVIMFGRKIITMDSVNTPIKRIVIHCSYTKPSHDIGVEELRKFHTADPPPAAVELDFLTELSNILAGALFYGRGWSDVGYHYIIRRDGTVEEGRPEHKIGAGVAGFNTGSLHVCLVGGMKEKEEAPDFNFTAEQMESLKNYVHSLVQKHSTKDEMVEVIGHRDFNPYKACPCFDVRAWWYRS